LNNLKRHKRVRLLPVNCFDDEEIDDA